MLYRRLTVYGHDDRGVLLRMYKEAHQSLADNIIANITKRAVLKPASKANAVCSTALLLARFLLLLI